MASVVLATGGYDHKIRFWEAPSGLCTRIIKFPDSQINKLEITPDKQFIAAAGNPVIRLYEIQTQSQGNNPTSTNGGGGSSNNSTGSNNNNDNGNDGGVGIGVSAGMPSTSDHQQQPQQAVLTLEGHTNNVSAVGFQRDGRYLFSGSEDRTVKVWDLRNPNYSRSFKCESAVNAVCLRADRDELICGTQDGYVKVWDLQSNGCLQSFRPAVHYDDPNLANDLKSQHRHRNNTNPPSSMAKPSTTTTTPNPTTTASAARAAALAKNILSPSSKTPSFSAASSCSSSTSSSSSSVVGKCFAIQPIQAVDISEDSRTLVAITNHSTVFVWDPSCGRNGPGPQQQQQQQQQPFTPSGDGGDVGGIDGPEQDPATPTATNAVDENRDNAGGGGYSLRPITKYRAHSNHGIYCLYGKIAPDCRHLVTCGSDGYSKLWDTTTWECTETLDSNTNSSNPPPTTTAPHRSGQMNGTSHHHHAYQQQQKRVGWIWDAAFCADSSYLVTASSDHIARLWNLRTGDVVRRYHGHQSSVTAVALNDSSI